jgi:hypothetical protein
MVLSTSRQRTILRGDLKQSLPGRNAVFVAEDSVIGKAMEESDDHAVFYHLALTQ